VGSLTFYFDRNFGKRFPKALVQIKPPFQIEYHHSENNRFAQEMRDDEWLRICGERGWIAFSQDRLDKIPVEAMAIKQHVLGRLHCGEHNCQYGTNAAIFFELTRAYELS